MPFVKLDTRILDSTLWVDRECRDIFITALLMAEPVEFTERQPQLSVYNLESTGFTVPPGWYGFIPSAGIGIVNRSGVERNAGMAALQRLGDPDYESRSKEFDGRRLVRINGGYVVLNYMKYREKDYTAPERMRRYREKLKGNGSYAVTSGQTVTKTRNVTQDREQSTHQPPLSPTPFPPENRVGKGLETELEIKTRALSRTEQSASARESRALASLDQTQTSSGKPVNGNGFVARTVPLQQKSALGDDRFAEFQAACVDCGLPFSERDLETACGIWSTLDFEQQLAAISGLRERKAAGEFSDANFRPLPQNYLDKRIWQRPVRIRASNSSPPAPPPPIDPSRIIPWNPNGPRAREAK